ncbi:chloride channel [Musa troglodytarum]|uniref:Chloride channel protein n=1 Tax=Musa troglodytarum TaxID=320322 RepID=A0A9E7H9F8_9LILI|nr:chloride channel [Musa troglodytarum]
MLSNHLHNGIQTAMVVWSRVPSSEEGEAAEVEFASRSHGGTDAESLDYELVENYAYRKEQAQRGKLCVSYYVVLKWLFSLVIGIGTGLSAVFINLAVENFLGWKYAATFSIIQHSYIVGFLVYIIFNLGLVFSSVLIITKFAPAAAGSGIPEIKGYLNALALLEEGLLLENKDPLFILVLVLLHCLDKVDPRSTILFPSGYVFKSDRDRRDLVTCGCAAGVAAAFRAPVGGVLFALEEVTSWWRSQLMWRVFFTSAVVAVVVRSAMSWCKSGKCGHFGSGGFIIWDIPNGQEDYSFQELLPMAIIGIISGILGALFNQLTLYVTSWRRKYLHKKGNRVKVLEVCIISLITSVISFGLPLLRSCSPCPDSETNPGIECPRPPGMDGDFVNFYCANDREYNDLATIFFNTQVVLAGSNNSYYVMQFSCNCILVFDIMIFLWQDDAIRNLFSAKTFHEYSAQSLLTFLVMFYSLAVVTFGTAVPAGQFVPGIMIGLTYGRLVGMFVVKFYKKLNVEEGTYALLGAASFLGGSMQMTVSFCVIMVEITNNLKLLPLIMLVLLISKAVGDFFNKGLYEEQAQLRGIPLLESTPKQYLRNGAAKEACKNQKVIDHKQNGEALVIGLIFRRSKMDFQNSPFPCDMRGISNRQNFSDFVKTVSRKGLSIEDIHLTEDELELYLDLAPYLNPPPYIVPEDQSLAKVCNLFRQLGLRHISVVPRPSHVIGLITRKDLLIEESDHSATMELSSTSGRI